MRSVVPQSDVMVHTDPHDDTEDILQRVRLIARGMRQDVHNVAVQRIGKHMHVAYDLEVAPDLSLSAAHDLASSLEHRPAPRILPTSRVSIRTSSRACKQRRPVKM